METTTYDLKTAKRIAYFGALKMDAQGYQYSKTSPWNLAGATLRNGGFRVVSPERRVYSVQDDPFTPISEPRRLLCTCKFFEKQGVCKHTTRVEWLLKDEETALEMADFEDRIALEAESRMSAECPKFGCVATS